MPMYPYAALSVPNMKRYLHSEDRTCNHQFASTDDVYGLGFQPDLADHMAHITMSDSCQSGGRDKSTCVHTSTLDAAIDHPLRVLQTDRALCMTGVCVDTDSCKRREEQLTHRLGCQKPFCCPS